MFRSLLCSFFAIFVICSFCGKEFQSLGRHSWRCKEKLKDSEKDQSNHSKGSRKGKMSNNNEDDCVASNNCLQVECSCGKICNGLRGLKMHQRSCRVIQGLSDISIEDNRIYSENANGTTNSYSSNISNTMPVIKPGIKLPKAWFPFDRHDRRSRHDRQNFTFTIVTILKTKDFHKIVAIV